MHRERQPIITISCNHPAAITSVSPNDAHHCATVSSIITPPLIAIDVTHWVGSAPSLVGSPMVIRWLLSVYFMAVEGSSWVV